jgi:uncharacterized membrane protein required for colicin V production
MYWLDTAILVLIGVGAALGAWTGLLKQIVRIVGLIASLAAAVFLHGWAADLLRQSVLRGSDPLVADGIAYVILFLGVLLAFQITAMVIDRFLKAVKLKWADRVLGCVVGGLKAALILGAVAMAAIAFPPNPTVKDALQQSRVAPVLAAGVDLAAQAVPVSYTEGLRAAWQKVQDEGEKKIKELGEKKVPSPAVPPSPIIP